MLDIQIKIDDADLEKRLAAFYDASKTESETLNVFCGRLVLGQLVGSEMNNLARTQEEAMRRSLQAQQQEFAKEADDKIQAWAKSQEPQEVTR